MIKNLRNENNKFLTYEQFSQKFSLKIPFTHFCGMLSAIPREWRRSLEASANHPAGLHVKGVTGPVPRKESAVGKLAHYLLVLNSKNLLLARGYVDQV